ncbi:hypothetical protein SAMN03097699_1018 [Flavobacteriaceae bacterium MAR_2010_188]|nr:hypothetical protein SAMN03097699_1018 [Flavobacteriaceae bacterium MAR_2010_188]
MRISTIIGLTAALFKKSKFKVIFVGIEFVYLAYMVLKRQREKQQKALPVKDDTTA